MSMTKCKICNAELKPNDKFCAECGAGIADQIISQPQAPQPQMSQASDRKERSRNPCLLPQLMQCLLLQLRQIYLVIKI